MQSSNHQAKSPLSMTSLTTDWKNVNS